MQGIGNDFVLIDATLGAPDDLPGLARAICDRHFGVGADGMILVLPSQAADLKMRIFNADGSEAEMCGNGVRCFARFVLDRGLMQKPVLKVETPSGIVIPRVEKDQVAVDMGEPRLERQAIPLSGAGQRAVDQELELDEGRFRFTAVSMGNPHCVIFVESLAGVPIAEWGPKIERHSLFPRQTNVEFVEVIDETHLKMLVWERGSGRTLACGTGACAAAVAANLNGKAGRRVRVSLEGGDLLIHWREADNHVELTGPAETVFTGRWPD